MNKLYSWEEVISKIRENKNLKFKDNNGIFIKYDSGCNTIRFYTTLDGKENTYKYGLSLSNNFELIQEPVDFMTAFNSGKQIKPVCLDKEKAYHPYIYWLGFMVSCNAYKESPQPLDLINGKWYIEE